MLLTELVVFGQAVERGDEISVGPGGKIVLAGLASAEDPTGRKESEYGRGEESGAKTRSAAGPRQGPSAAAASAKQASGTLGELGVAGLADLAIEYEGTHLIAKSATFAYLGIPLRVFESLPYRSKLLLEIPLQTRSSLYHAAHDELMRERGGLEKRAYEFRRLRLPGTRAISNETAEVSMPGPVAVPDVRVWAIWTSGPLEGGQVRSFHQYPDNSICAYKPGYWLFGVHPLISLVDACLYWVAKALHDDLLGSYPGPQHSTSWVEWSRDHAEEACSCESGSTYGECHQPVFDNASPYDLHRQHVLGAQAYLFALHMQGRPSVPWVGLLANARGVPLWRRYP